MSAGIFHVLSRAAEFSKNNPIRPERVTGFVVLSGDPQRNINHYFPTVDSVSLRGEWASFCCFLIEKRNPSPTAAHSNATRAASIVTQRGTVFPHWTRTQSAIGRMNFANVSFSVVLPIDRVSERNGNVSPGTTYSRRFDCDPFTARFRLIAKEILYTFPSRDPREHQCFPILCSDDRS